jgi:formylglycine-generating enzyme required for sulfatase activity
MMARAKAPKRAGGIVRSALGPLTSTLIALIACSAPHTDARFTGDAPGEAPPGMVWVAGGRFLMGSEGPLALPDEGPAHDVDVNGFFMDAHTVTNARFRAFVEATGYVTVAERAPDAAALLAQLPSGTAAPPKELLVPGSIVFAPTDRPVDLRDWSQWWRWAPGASWRHPDGPGSSIEGREDHPVVQVAWEDAVAYATWAGTRLPTEAEWEFAARSGQAQREHAWSDVPVDSGHPPAHIYDGRFPTHPASTKPVGSYPPNDLGLFDMAGNVWEWTGDWYHPDTYRAQKARGVPINPKGPAAGLDPANGSTLVRVIRGGSFLCNDSYCRGYRASARLPGATDTGAPHIGFRTVMSVAEWEAWRQRGASTSR